MSSDGQHFVVFPKGTLDYLEAPVIIDPQGSTLAKRAFCDGVQARPLSADERIMVVSIFSAATGPGSTGLLIWNRVTDTLTRLVPTAPTTDPYKFSGDGRRIAFWSTATNLVGPPRPRATTTSRMWSKWC